MRAFLLFITLFLLSQASAWGQVVVGTYHLAATDKDYVVLIDDMENRFKGKTPDEQLFKWQICLQVESNDPKIDTYLSISRWHPDKFYNALYENFAKAQKVAQKKSFYRKKIGDGDIDLFLKRCEIDKITGNGTYGYESGNDFNISCEKNDEGQLFLCYTGEAAKSEGGIGLSVSGWRLIITSIEEIQRIEGLIFQAQEMIMSSGSNLE